MALRILLLQAREEDDPMLEEEVLSFAEKSGLDPECFVQHDLLAGPPELDRVLEHDALMVGGSGDYYVSQRNLPGFDELLGVLAEVAAAGHPTFASCFGFQLLTVALGGEIVHDPDSTEVGTYELWLTPEGRKDPLLGGLSPRFHAQLGRKDRAARLPPGVPNLAASKRNPHQALRLPGRPVWATQFHPELDARTNRLRFLRYLDGYSMHMTREERRTVLDRYLESPETERLLPRFLELVFGEPRGRALVTIAPPPASRKAAS